ncbi:uncharacterized protein LOC9304084 [Arabidopsis lyrata subsp. lyrata]|nr:uncharacterized protein LOC9304084 [Arabidopsis lyrata subsp. lyrata]|eukprot:XP_020874385.1 uncharacterized protein LOC9304084 [Arabidopsis lyrata subsp. lyrata]
MKKKMSPESSIFSTILTDIEENPTILQKQSNLSGEFSVFSTIITVGDEENPTIPQKKLKKSRRRGSMKKTPIDFSCTVSQNLTHSDLVGILNEELKILRSEIEIKGQKSDQFVSCDSDHVREECDFVEEGKVEQREEVKFLADEVIEWLLRDEIVESEISTDAEDSVCKVDGNILGTFDGMLSTMLGDEDTGPCGGIDEFIENMLEEIEKDGSYLDWIKDSYVFGGLLENLIRDRFREKAEKEEKEISSWISNGEPEVDETGVAEEEKEEKMDVKETKKKLASMVVKMEWTEQESTVTKRDCFGYRQRLYLIEKLTKRHEDLMKMRRKAVRFGMELSFLVAEFMFLIPNEILAGETGDYSICTKLFGVNEDDKGTSVIIGKLEAVFEIVIWKKVSKEHDVDLPESIFRYDDFIRLCADATQALGKIVWDLKGKHCERLKLSDLDFLFEDCQKVLMKIELKLAEMKQWVYRSVSADYESFSKSERSDSFLRIKLMKRVIADNRYGRSVIGSYLVEIWQSLFQAEALQEL